jgi:hypothetical protein
MKLSDTLLASLIENSQGRFCTCTFVKKDGTIRTLNGRIGVKSARVTEGTVRKTAKQEQYITMYDIQKRAYRSVNRASITALNIDGVQIKKQA